MPGVAVPHDEAETTTSVKSLFIEGNASRQTKNFNSQEGVRANSGKRPKGHWSPWGIQPERCVTVTNTTKRKKCWYGERQGLFFEYLSRNCCECSAWIS